MGLHVRKLNITARAITADDNMRAFERNGQNVDEKPCYSQMLNTCIRDITREEENLLWKHLPQMIQLVDKPELTKTPAPTAGALISLCALYFSVLLT